MGLNILIFSGRVGVEPVVSMIGENKKAVVRLANTKKYKSKGEKVEKTTWLDVEVWGRLADIVEEYVVKGQEVTFTGELDMGSYEKEDGQKHYYTRMKASSMELGNKPRGESDSGGGVSPERVKGLIEQALHLKDNGIENGTAIAVVLQSLSE